MGLSVKVDSATSVAGKTIALVVAYAGVGDKIGVAEGAAAGSIELDAGPDGKLEGLATVCKFVASLASEPVRGQFAGASRGRGDDLGGSLEPPRSTASRARGRREAGRAGQPPPALVPRHARRRLPGGPRRIRHDARRVVRDGAGEASRARPPDALVRPRQAARRETFGRFRSPRAEPMDLSPPVEDKKEKERAGAKKTPADATKDAAGKAVKKGAPGPAPGGDKPDAEAVAAARAAKKAAKAEKDKAKGKVPAAAMPKKEITVDVLDIKVGTITRAWEHPGADKLWVESIDVGEAKERQIVSGLRAFKTKAQMEGARVLVLCNVKKGPLRDELSEGMVMCASDEAHTQVDFVVPPAGRRTASACASPGSRASLWRFWCRRKNVRGVRAQAADRRRGRGVLRRRTVHDLRGSVRVRPQAGLHQVRERRLDSGHSRTTLTQSS